MENNNPLWFKKADQIIGELCLESCKRANPVRGKKYKPYSVPQTVLDLIECKRTNDEERAKSIMIRYTCFGIKD